VTIHLSCRLLLKFNILKNMCLVLSNFDGQQRVSAIRKGLGTGTHLFVKVPRPGDSKGTFSVFESSCRYLSHQLTTQR